MVTALQPATNDGAKVIALQRPYSVIVRITGVAPILFHRWSVESVAAKAAARRGSAAKKTDDVESYVYRCADGTLGIPGAYLLGGLCDQKNGAAKYRHDPRSPRKSALDLFRAGVSCLTEIASLGVTQWDYLDQRRVTVQRNGITRVRPAMLAGWSAEFVLSVITPEYISQGVLLECLTDAGRLVGMGDFRPTYGRYQITRFDIT